MGKLFAAAAAVVVIIVCAPSVKAADGLIHDFTPMALKGQLQSWGFGVFAHTTQADMPQLVVTPKNGDGNDFTILMTGCLPNDAPFYQRRCDGLMYRARIKRDIPIETKTFARWNRALNAARAYQPDHHARLVWRTSLQGGVGLDHVKATLAQWRGELKRFIDHVDAAEWD